MGWNRFDICEAWYCFAVDFHGGQWSPEYLIFGRLHDMRFKPALSLKAETLTDNGKEIYYSLIDRLEDTSGLELERPELYNE